MNIPPRPKAHWITGEVPEHLLGASQHTNAEFFANAHGGQTPTQRAAEIRAGDRDRGFDSVLRLVDVARSDAEQAKTLAEFLAGLSTGTDYPFDLTALQGLDDDIFEHCLAVLGFDHRPDVEVHCHFPDGQQRWQRIITRWNLDKRPPAEPPPIRGERYLARFGTHSEGPAFVVSRWRSRSTATQPTSCRSSFTFQRRNPRACYAILWRFIVWHGRLASTATGRKPSTAPCGFKNPIAHKENR